MFTPAGVNSAEGMSMLYLHSQSILSESSGAVNRFLRFSCDPPYMLPDTVIPRRTPGEQRCGSLRVQPPSPREVDSPQRGEDGGSVTNSNSANRASMNSAPSGAPRQFLAAARSGTALTCHRHVIHFRASASQPSKREPESERKQDSRYMGQPSERWRIRTKLPRPP